MSDNENVNERLNELLKQNSECCMSSAEDINQISGMQTYLNILLSITYGYTFTRIIGLNNCKINYLKNI